MPEGWDGGGGYSKFRKRTEHTIEMQKILGAMEIHILNGEYEQMDICIDQLLELATMDKLKENLGDDD